METALTNSDGSLKLDKLAIQTEYGDKESSVQHILLHHTKTREDGSQYLLYGSAVRDICRMFEIINEKSGL